MRRLASSSFVVTLLIHLACIVSFARAGHALRLVPDDVGLCLAVRNLRSDFAAVAKSPFLDEFRKTDMGRRLLDAPEFRKLVASGQKLHKVLGTSWQDLRDEILGDEVVFAYRPSTNSGNEENEEDGLFVLQARNAKILADLIDRLNSLERNSKELTSLHEREYRGITYTERVSKKSRVFYFRHDGILAVATREATLKQLIDRNSQASVAPANLDERIAKLGLTNALAVLWVNPRAFDIELEQQAASTSGAEKLAVEKMRSYWKALDGIAFSLMLEKQQISLQLTLLVRPKDLPPLAQRFFLSDNDPSELWNFLPNDAVLAAAGRVDIPALVAFLGEFLPADAKEEIRRTVNRGIGAALGLDVSHDILPNLGPDWGIAVRLNEQDGQPIAPEQLFALKVCPGKKDKSVGQALTDGLNALALFAVIGYNSSGRPDAFTLKRERQGNTEVKYLVNDDLLPKGVRPAYAIKDEYLLLASSPDAIRHFRAGSGIKAEKGLLVRLSLSRLADFLAKHRVFLLQRWTKGGEADAATAKRRLDNFLAIVRLFDRIELKSQGGNGRSTLSLSIHTKLALRGN